MLPLLREKLLLSAGGGWSGLQTNETIQANPGEDIICLSCQSLRGWGPTEIAEVMFFPGDQRNVGVGVHVRGVQIITNGLSVPGTNVSGKDHFLLIGGRCVFTIRRECNSVTVPSGLRGKGTARDRRPIHDSSFVEAVKLQNL